MSLNGTGNVLLTDDIIIKEALVLLKNELVVAPTVYRDLEKRFAKKGDIISLKLPFRTRSASGRTLVKQPLVDKTIPFQIDRQEHFGLEVTMRDRTLSLEQFSDRYLRSGIVQVANVIDRSILLEMRKRFYASSGTPGTASTIADLRLAYAYMGKVGVPDDGQRRAMLDMIDMATLSNEMSGKYVEMLAKEALQKGYKGPLGGFETFESANMPTHTVGDHGGSPVVNTASQTGSSLITDGWDVSTTGLLKEGDVITISGVYEINPQNYTSTGRLQNFVVTADVDSDGSGNATIPIYPAINDGTLTTVDEDGNTISLRGYQNVSAAPADNAPIVVLGTANTEYRQNFLYHKTAVALAMIDLELPQSAVVKSRVRDPDSGLSLCMTGAYDINEQSEVTRIDAVWGTHVIYGELGHRMWSDNVG